MDSNLKGFFLLLINKWNDATKLNKKLIFPKGEHYAMSKDMTLNIIEEIKKGECNCTTAHTNLELRVKNQRWLSVEEHMKILNTRASNVYSNKRVP